MLRKTIEQFIEEAKLVHGDKYDYSLVEYKNTDTKVNIICNKCGNIFSQSPYKHIRRKQGCPFCANNRAFTKEDFIQRAKKLHGDKYDYSKTVYIRAVDKVEIFCKKCNKYFWQEARTHMYRAGCCYCRESIGEEKIRSYLENKGIFPKGQKKYNDLFDKELLSYDFYVEEYNLLIEFNGEQHYNSKAFNKTYKDFLIQKHHDWLKRKYANKNGINFLVIPYWEFENIENILEKYIQDIDKKIKLL